tara:strand:- start:251 stop:361 length:111 start_codon:yes stop_codon:yes gene_type:complete
LKVNIFERKKLKEKFEIERKKIKNKKCEVKIFEREI